MATRTVRFGCAPIVFRMRNEAYQVQKAQADQLVNDMLLIDEANKRQIGFYSETRISRSSF